MSYEGISIHKAMERINACSDGWFLPQTQRQYVWGARHESEEYVCLLLDSLLRGYPIGGIVLWKTEQNVPYREFITNYTPEAFALEVDEGKWGAPKSLIYDGQQRLQTLYSVLRYSFNERALFFDILFDRSAVAPDETGFLFFDKNDKPGQQYLRMTELFSSRPDAKRKIELRDILLQASERDNNQKRIRIEENLDNLWRVFVENEAVKSIAYFSVEADDHREVHEVYRRLNTGGIPLGQLELVLGNLKTVYSDYEERLRALSEKLKQVSGGIEFSYMAILQFFHLLIKKTVRIDDRRWEASDASKFEDILTNHASPLAEFFCGYLSQLFNVNHYSIVPRWLAVLPIATYLTELERSGREYRIRALEDSDSGLRPINEYFLHSQLCDWNTQTMVNAFSDQAARAGQAGKPFPMAEIREVAIKKNRRGLLSEIQLREQPWFALKVLMRDRKYVFQGDKPHLDHIFPIHLGGQDDTYREAVNILWNLQPVPADINGYKRAQHPRKFLASPDGRKYSGCYDFIPETGSPLWDDYKEFLKFRKHKMIEALTSRYGLTLAAT